MSHGTRPTPVQRRLLITGCGRSGTKYTAWVLQRLGLDVGHETMGEDGTVSWLMAVDAERTPFGTGSRGYEFQHVLHQVRHPLAVIGSALTFKSKSWRFICEHAPIAEDAPVLLRAAHYWHYWNLEAEKRAQWRYRIEDFSLVFDELCQRAGVVADRSALSQVATDVNTRRYGRLYHIYQEICGRAGVRASANLARFFSTSGKLGHSCAVTWRELEALSREVTGQVRDTARRYGYDV